jgi:hypothetical protein
MNPWATICGYVDRENGLVYPCDLGCCVPNCQGLGKQPPGAVQFRKSDGNKLPQGYGNFLPIPPASSGSYSPDLDQMPQGAAPFDDTDPPDSWKGGVKVWQIFLLLFIILAVVLVSSFLA